MKATEQMIEAALKTYRNGYDLSAKSQMECALNAALSLLPDGEGEWQSRAKSAEDMLRRALSFLPRGGITPSLVHEIVAFLGAECREDVEAPHGRSGRGAADAPGDGAGAIDSGTGWSVEQEREDIAAYLDAKADAFTGWDGVAVSLREAAKAIRSRVTPSEGGQPEQGKIPSKEAVEAAARIIYREHGDPPDPHDAEREARKTALAVLTAAYAVDFLQPEQAQPSAPANGEYAELVARLRYHGTPDDRGNLFPGGYIAREAADAITALERRAKKAEAQLAEARKALEHYARWDNGGLVAREALASLPSEKQT